jgi:hypothetical protein
MASGYTRRSLLARSAAVAAMGVQPQPGVEATAPSKPEGRKRRGKTALCLNEDDSHYFFTRAGQDLDREKVASWVDQYAGTQVRELMLNPNAMRTSYGSKVWDPIWRGYDPEGPDDQPLLASLPPDGRKGIRAWVHTAWKLHQDGIDPYAVWIDRARARGVSPWISMRMNDLHNVDDEKNCLHSEFWRENPQLRRVPYRFDGWTDRAFDYGRAEVRDYHFKLIEELAERYDFDGLELDWMRFGFHFRPGKEAEGAGLLTGFTARTRKLLDRWEKKRGHKIRLGARVPSRPQTAVGLGMDAVTWAKQGLIQMLVVTPFWASTETDMPIELWKQLLEGTKVTLAAGLEVLCRPSPGYSDYPMNSLQTVRGMASSMLDRGADRVYLFNYMDSQTAMADLENYPTLLRECGSLDTLEGKARRHVVTFADTWAPGEPHGDALPAAAAPGRWNAFRVHAGPPPVRGDTTVRLGIEGAVENDAATWEVRLNGEVCRWIGAVAPQATWPTSPVYGFRPPASAVQRGYNLVEVAPKRAGRIIWVEMAMETAPV